MADDILRVEDLGEGLQRLTMNRPDRLNALNQPMAEGLLAHFEGLRRSPVAALVASAELQVVHQVLSICCDTLAQCLNRDQQSISIEAHLVSCRRSASVPN